MPVATAYVLSKTGDDNSVYRRMPIDEDPRMCLWRLP